MRNGLITPNEIAERLGVERQTIYLWVRQRRILNLTPFSGEADKPLFEPHAANFNCAS